MSQNKALLSKIISKILNSPDGYKSKHKKENETFIYLISNNQFDSL